MINKRENVSLDHFNYSKTFIEYSSNVQGAYKDIDENSPGKKRKVLIVFDVKIADMSSN